MTVLAQRDKRFRRTSRPVRPRLAARRWLRALRVLRGVFLTSGFVLAGYQAVVLLPASSLLTVNDIVVNGNDRLSDGEVLALLSGLKGQSILEVDLEAQRRRLAVAPWLVGGTLRRSLPSTIEVLVDERDPVAVARFVDRLYLVDASGEVLDQYGPRFAGLNLPIVDGLVVSEEKTAVVEPMRMALAVKLLGQLAAHPEVLGAISQIDVADPYNAVVLLNDDPALLHLGADRFFERLRFYAELAPALRARVNDIDYVDLRFGQKVIVRPMT